MEKSKEAPSELSGPQSYKVHWDIVLLAREITKTFEFIFSEFDLNLTDVALISLIDQSDAFTQSQLAKSLGIGKARLGIVINDLETKDILERTVNPYDRRAWLIKLTPKGDALRKELQDKYFLLKDISNEFVDLQNHQNLADNLNVFRMDLLRLKQEIEDRVSVNTSPSESLDPLYMQ